MRKNFFYEKNKDIKKNTRKPARERLKAAFLSSSLSLYFLPVEKRNLIITSRLVSY